MGSATIYPTQLLIGCHEHLGAAFPDEHFVFAELDGVLTGLYNSIRWSILRRAESEQSERPILDLPTLDCFASHWMSRDEIVERISDTSGLEPEMSDIALRSIEDSVRLSLSENEAVATPPIGVIMKGQQGFLIRLDEAFQLKPTSMAAATSTAAAASAAAY